MLFTNVTCLLQDLLQHMHPMKRSAATQGATGRKQQYQVSVKPSGTARVVVSDLGPPPLFTRISFSDAVLEGFFLVIEIQAKQTLTSSLKLWRISWVCLLLVFYLEDKAEVGRSSELLPVVPGCVDVDVFKANQAGEIAGRLQARGELSRSKLITFFLTVLFNIAVFVKHRQTFVFPLGT